VNYISFDNVSILNIQYIFSWVKTLTWVFLFERVFELQHFFSSGRVISVSALVWSVSALALGRRLGRNCGDRCPDMSRRIQMSRRGSHWRRHLMSRRIQIDCSDQNEDKTITRLIGTTLTRRQNSRGPIRLRTTREWWKRYSYSILVLCDIELRVTDAKSDAHCVLTRVLPPISHRRDLDPSRRSELLLFGVNIHHT
jgi:hypothetical protein